MWYESRQYGKSGIGTTYGLNVNPLILSHTEMEDRLNNSVQQQKQ